MVLSMVASLIAVALSFRGIMLPFILALVVAYVIDPLVTWMQRNSFIPIINAPTPRWVSVACIYLAFFFLVSVFATYAIPPMVVTIKDSVTNEWPKVRQSVEDWVEKARTELEEEKRNRSSDGKEQPETPATVKQDGSGAQESDSITPRSLTRKYGIAAYEWVEREGPKKLQSWGISNAYQLVSNIAVPAFVLLFKGLFLLVIILMVGAFISIDSRGILRFIYGLFPSSFQDDLSGLLGEINTGLSGIIRGQIVICLVNGSLTGIGLWIFGIPFALILTIVATCFSLIPVFGTVLSTIPCVLIGTVTPDGVGGHLAGAIILAWIAAIHALEAYVLNPKIIGSHANIHPVLVLFALIAGEHSYGLLGALLGVPVASILQNIFLFCHDRLTTAYEQEAIRTGAEFLDHSPAELEDQKARERILEKLRIREERQAEKREHRRQKKDIKNQDKPADTEDSKNSS